MGAADFERVMRGSRAALDMIVNGNPEGYTALYSRAPDITLGNPFGGFARGWDEVAEQLERAASHYSAGKTTGFETITQVISSELAYTVEIERFTAMVGDRPDPTAVALRVTCIYRRENGDWRLVHRHADPRVSRHSAGSVLEG